MNLWTTLGMQASSDERDIKRAYAKKLKVTRPDDDPVAFQQLHDAYESALRLARQAFQADADADDGLAPAPAYPELPAPAPAAAPAMEQARQLWVDFLPNSGAQPRQLLSRIAASDAMLNMEVRECFELYAAEYCATGECSDALREDAAAHFGWDDDLSFIQRYVPDAASQMVARIRAGRSLAMFTRLAPTDSAVAELLAPSVSRTGFLMTTSRKFTLNMRHLLRAIEWDHPELAHFKLNPDVLALWKRRADSARYFVEYAGVSVMAGMLLCLTLLIGLSALDVTHHATATIFMLTQAGSIGGGLALAFLTPLGTLERWAQRVTHGRHVLLSDWRMRPVVQFGWIGALAIASVLILVPHPGQFLIVAVRVMAFAALLAALFANSAAFDFMSFFFGTAIGIFIGIDTAAHSELQHGFFTTCAVLICVIQLICRGGADFWQFAGVPESRLPGLRLVWMCGMIYFLLGADHTPLPLQLHTALAMLWMIAGALLSRPSILPLFAILGSIFINVAILATQPATTALKQRPLSAIALAMVAITIFIGVNMKRAREHQHQFA